MAPRTRGPFELFDTFGVHQPEITSIANAWFTQSIAIHALDFDPFTKALAPGSAVAQALCSAAQPAARATGSIADRLAQMSRVLRTFNSESADTDNTAAAAFDEMRHR
ncbi:hypothetical protein QSJ18_17435 [Gordonia sp. ABSL1-1]|uniref:hypothetical protein n=1 Tax=Gordonia sp. ABSL1-1 TaxID=3053923 RepID=UPI002573B336|nr:hypothetical protein [Gordonia sp. ABSL1-1]MDL9938532.1 hypothetical protein [Gordonia sp. ABSL1-1]